MMSSAFRRPPAAVLVALVIVVAAACASTSTQSASMSTAQPTPAGAPSSEAVWIAKARADSARLPYTAADVNFMTGMIAHHAQAVLMAGWAKSHGASESVQTLCDRITNAQKDEIATMQQWLRDRSQAVPDAKPGPMKMMMNGMEHEMLMPGMLTDEQLARLDSARGIEFDRLFLTGMIQHHRGAIQMVKDLFATPGAGQDELTLKLASDINVDQATEVARMQRMLTILKIEHPSS